MAVFNCRVSGILLNADKEVLLVRRNAEFVTDNKDKSEHIGWEFCGGGIEHNETPSYAIEREYAEEVGLKVSAIQLFNARTGFRDEMPLLNLSYICAYISGTIRLTDEHTDFKWVSFAELRNIDLGRYANCDKEVFLKLYSSKE